VDIATDLIRLSGLTVGTDIEIKFTGMRPGEKLYEEMFFSAENVLATGHPKVLRARNGILPEGVMRGPMISARPPADVCADAPEAASNANPAALSRRRKIIGKVNSIPRRD